MGESSQSLRVEQTPGSNASLTLANIKVPKNGYCFVYLSNESDEMVYFDNFQVGHTRGRIIEENHYYSYGLKIAALSSKKGGDATYEGLLDNKYLYNDKELWDEADLNWYDYGFRNYDPQIGRFTQLDPLTDDYPELTPYQYASCEPIANIDVDGLEALNSIFTGAQTVGNSTGLVSNASNMAGVVVVGIKSATTATKAANIGLSVASMAIKAVDIATDFLPGSGIKDVYRGVKNGDGWQVALGVGSLVFDAVTLGSGSIIKGTVKTIVKAGAKTAVKAGAKTVLKQESKVIAGNAAMKFVGCFVAGTLVWTTEDSTIAIEKVKVGDVVYAYDVEKKKVVKRKVTDAYVRQVDRLIKLEYEGEVIYTTSEHPFYVRSKWIEAAQLKAGDSLFLGDGRHVALGSITSIDTAVTVYNFTVAEDHNYFVGRARVLVHNNNPCAQAVKETSRGLWKLTKERAILIKNHKTFGTIYKSKSDDLWWAVDKAGHGSSKFKVFKETNKGLEWFKDADEYGDFILNKHKGSTGQFIPWGQLSTVK